MGAYIRTVMKLAYNHRLLLSGAILVFAVELLVLVPLREAWVDELFFEWKGLLLLNGSLIPFVNGLFEYPPLGAILYGLTQFLFGPDIMAGRILSAVFFAGGAALLFFSVVRLAGRSAGVAALFLLASNLLLMGNFASATLYSLTFLILSGAVFLETAALPRTRKTIFQSILLALAVLVRTNMIAAVLAYLLFLFFVERRLRIVFLSAGVVLLVAMLGYLPVVLPNPSLALAHLFSVFGNLGPLTDLPASLKVGSYDIGRFLEVLTSFVKEYLGFLVLFAVTIALLMLREGRRFLLFLRAEPAFALLVFFSVILLLAHFGYIRIVGNVYYANYFIPFLLAAAVVSAWRFFPNDRALRVAVISVVVLTGAFNLFRTDVVSSPSEESDLARIRRGAAVLEEHTKPADRIVSFDNSLFHLFSAKRLTHLPLLNRDFLYLPDADSGKVSRMGFYNLAMVTEWLREADYLVIHKEKWSLPYKRSPFWGEGTEDTRARLLEISAIIEKNFTLVAEAPNVYPRKYTKGNDGGTLLLYRRIR